MKKFLTLVAIASIASFTLFSCGSGNTQEQVLQDSVQVEQDSVQLEQDSLQVEEDSVLTESR
jgi:uncharacterized protein YgiB involved in biofilm formation